MERFVNQTNLQPAFWEEDSSFIYAGGGGLFRGAADGDTG